MFSSSEDIKCKNESQINKIKVFIVDDHYVTRQGLYFAFQNEKDIEIVGEAENGLEAIEKSDQIEIDLAIVDIRLPDISGFQVAKELKELHPDIYIIMMTGYDSELYLAESLHSQIAGFISKESPKDFILNAIRFVASGGSAWDRNLLNQAISGLSPSQLNFEYEEENKISLLQKRLSNREIQILVLIAKGYANKQISHQLNYSVATIKKNIKEIMIKLKTSNRTQLAVIASQLRLI